MLSKGASHEAANAGSWIRKSRVVRGVFLTDIASEAQEIAEAHLTNSRMGVMLDHLPLCNARKLTQFAGVATGPMQLFQCKPPGPLNDAFLPAVFLVVGWCKQE
jgi:hypothetical protein